MAAYAKHDGAFFSQRAIFLVAIILVHILLIYLFNSGLVSKAMKVIDPPIAVDIVQEQKKIDAPPPPPPPKMERPPVEIPPPDVVINVPAEPNSTAIREVTPQRAAPPAPPPPRAEVRTQAKPDKRHWPDPQDYYPPTSRRMNETGTALINFCWGADGKVTGEPKIEKSSGSPRLDEAAVRYTKNVRMVPGTVDGRPTAACSNLPVKFQLVD